MCEKERVIFLVGIGMGTGDGMTVQAEKCIRSCDCLIGAQRMLESVGGEVRKTKPMLAEYRPTEIVSYTERHPEYRRIGVLLSGDTGFYSGAKKLASEIREQMKGCGVEMIPGISSVVYLAARLETSWEDAAMVSLHGKEADFISTADRNRKTFLLLGSAGSGEQVLKKLLEYGMDHVTVHAGSRLSYEDEKIISGKPSELTGDDLEGLCTLLIENPHPSEQTGSHISDEAVSYTHLTLPTNSRV